MAPPKGFKHTEESRRHMGESHIGYKHSEETRKKYSESKKGEKNPMYGTHHTEESKRKISEAEKGKAVSEETRRKISKNQTSRGRPKGFKHTEESKKKMSESRKGIIFSEEHLKNLSGSHKGQMVSPEGRKSRSEYNKSHPEVIERLRRVRVKRPSGPQAQLFERIKELYPEYEVKMECRVITPVGRRYIDVAVPSLKIGFEYDPPHWHLDKNKDMERHRLIENEGWKPIHYSDVSEFP